MKEIPHSISVRLGPSSVQFAPFLWNSVLFLIIVNIPNTKMNYNFEFSFLI